MARPIFALRVQAEPGVDVIRSSARVGQTWAARP
jgi:hypothetical protein